MNVRIIICLGLILLSSFSQAATLYTGDRIDGTPVISQLDVNDLPAGKYRFMFQGVSNGIGQYWYIPTMVIKGQQSGPALGLQAGIHGDELNGIRVIQKIFDELEPSQLNGSIVAAIGTNPSGLLAGNRNWQIMTDGGTMVDFNRIWPGKEKGDAAEIQAWLLWTRLWRSNVDMFIDMHTQSRGTAYPLFIFADYRDPKIKEMAELIPADQIKADPGEKGSVETTFVEHRIPAITLEIGQPKRYQPELIERSVTGIRNILAHQHMIQTPIGQTAKDVPTYLGNDVVSIRAETGGFTEILVDIGEEIKKGQLVAIQRNAFGDIIKRYEAPQSGKVLAIGDDPLREPNALLVRILFWNTDRRCNKGC